jgi:hypothetical protein
MVCLQLSTDNEIDGRHVRVFGCCLPYEVGAAFAACDKLCNEDMGWTLLVGVLPLCVSGLLWVSRQGYCVLVLQCFLFIKLCVYKVFCQFFLLN